MKKLLLIFCFLLCSSVHAFEECSSNEFDSFCFDEVEAALKEKFPLGVPVLNTNYVGYSKYLPKEYSFLSIFESFYYDNVDYNDYHSTLYYFVVHSKDFKTLSYKLALYISDYKIQYLISSGKMKIGCDSDDVMMFYLKDSEHFSLYPYVFDYIIGHDEGKESRGYFQFCEKI